MLRQRQPQRVVLVRWLQRGETVQTQPDAPHVLTDHAVAQGAAGRILRAAFLPLRHGLATFGKQFAQMLGALGVGKAGRALTEEGVDETVVVQRRSSSPRRAETGVEGVGIDSQRVVLPSLHQRVDLTEACIAARLALAFGTPQRLGQTVEQQHAHSPLTLLCLIHLHQFGEGQHRARRGLLPPAAPGVVEDVQQVVVEKVVVLSGTHRVLIIGHRGAC